MASRRLRCGLASLHIVLVLGPAGASPAAEISIERESETIWTTTSLTDPSSEPLRVKILAPEPDGSRSLYQVCHFPSADGGPYRCGVDRSTAEQRSGRWVARAVLEGEPIGRRAFWVE